MPEKYSGKKVIKAGEQFLSDAVFNNEEALSSAMDVLSYWRFSHEVALDNALELLETISLDVDKKAITAKRLKRFVSIVKKLRRFPDMKLKNMQDIGGCRSIVANPKRLTQIVRRLRQRPEFKNVNGKIRYKDYIKTPKEDGYRGYHLVGNFDNGQGSKRSIELQVRTRLQHDWATTLEIVDLFTGQALKSNQGDHDWQEFFSSVSKQFSVMEEIHLFDTLTTKMKYEKYSQEILNHTPEIKDSCEIAQISASKLNVVKLLQAYSNSLKIVDGRISENAVDGYALIIVDTSKSTVTASLFNKDENEAAEREYIQAEKKFAGRKEIVVALVSTTAVGGIKEAYPNYFADSKDFILHLLFITNIQLVPARSFFSRLFK